MAYGQVKALLRSGKVDAETIISANQLADSLGVSRTPVREALLQLSSEGFLTALGSKGFQIRRFTRKEIEDTFEAREAIERWVVERLALRNDLNTEPLAEAMTRMECAAAADDPNAFIEADAAFHVYLVRALGNGLLASVMENIRDRISLLGRQALSVQGRMNEVLEEHRRIVEALRKGQAAAATQGMREHLEATRRYLLSNHTGAE
jgi:DNA-binding GntR family transcriptional regulator